MNNERYIPIDDDAEKAVLGALLASPALFDDVSDILAAEDFGMTDNQLVYQAILNVDAGGKPVDQVTVAAELKKGRHLTKIGGIEALDHLIETSLDADNVLAWAHIVEDKARLRRLHDAGREIARDAVDPQSIADDVLETAQQKVFALGETKGRSSMLTMTQAMPRTLDALARARTSVLIGHPTSIIGLDKMTAGFQGGQLIIIAGRPAMGKSSFAMQIAKFISESGEGVVPFLSYEMSVTELGMRLISHQLRYDLHRLRQGDIPSGMEKDLAKAAEHLAKTSLLIDDSPPETIAGVRSAMRRLARKEKVQAIFIDYLQLMSAEKRSSNDNRTQEVSEISRGLKRLASELDVPVIALSQLNRGLEQRPNKRPMLSDLRESGCLTADTRILRADTGAETTMGELFESGERNIPVWSLDENMKMVASNMTHVFYTGHREVFKMRTASGRVLEATANHKFLTLDGWVPLGDLEVGSRIAVPRSVPEALTRETNMSDDQIIVLAHMIGDGSMLKRQPIRYATQDTANLEAVRGAAERAFDVKTSVDDYPAARCLTLRMAKKTATGAGRRNPIVTWLDSMGLYDKRSHEKFVPECVFGLDDRQTALFLRHLWATDGSITMNKARSGGNVYYSSNSRQLIDDVTRLLLRFGVQARIKSAQKEGYRIGWMTHIYGATHQKLFLEKIGSHGARGVIGEKVLDIVSDTTVNTNCDTVPKEIWDIVREDLSEQGITHRIFAESMGTKFCGNTMWKHSPSRERLTKAGVILDNPTIKTLATSDIFWDEIVEITSIGMNDVYDATVEETHNFIGNGVLLHNSLEQDSNAVLFLYRHSVYDNSASGTEAECIVAKQRNGPVGTVWLTFDPQCGQWGDGTPPPAAGSSSKTTGSPW